MLFRSLYFNNWRTASPINKLLIKLGTLTSRQQTLYQHLFVENGLAADRIHGAMRREHPVGLAAAEPEPALFVQIAHVAHAVPEGAVRICNLGEPGLFRPVVIGRGHHRAVHHDFTDFTWRQEFGLGGAGVVRKRQRDAVH